MKVALIYINQSQLLKLRMKKFDKLTKHREETYSETCSGDSDSLASPRRHSAPRGRAGKQKNKREVLQPSPTQIRLFRFKLKHSRKTLRIPLFEEDLLNLPLRFTKRINAMEIDNDVETDQEMAGSEAQRCETWLRQAIAQQHKAM